MADEVPNKTLETNAFVLWAAEKSTHILRHPYVSSPYPFDEPFGDVEILCAVLRSSSGDGRRPARFLPSLTTWMLHAQTSPATPACIHTSTAGSYEPGTTDHT